MICVVTLFVVQGNSNVPTLVLFSLGADDEDGASDDRLEGGGVAKDDDATGSSDIRVECTRV